jgi:branched-subunit amino acid permease
MEVHGALAYAICALIMVSCIYTSLAMVTSAIEYLREFLTKLKKK